MTWRGEKEGTQQKGNVSCRIKVIKEVVIRDNLIVVKIAIINHKAVHGLVSCLFGRKVESV